MRMRTRTRIATTSESLHPRGRAGSWPARPPLAAAGLADRSTGPRRRPTPCPRLASVTAVDHPGARHECLLAQRRFQTPSCREADLSAASRLPPRTSSHLYRQRPARQKVELTGCSPEDPPALATGARPEHPGRDARCSRIRGCDATGAGPDLEPPVFGGLTGASIGAPHVCDGESCCGSPSCTVVPFTLMYDWRTGHDNVWLAGTRPIRSGRMAPRRS